jgi:hypothetical protein
VAARPGTQAAVVLPEPGTVLAAATATLACATTCATVVAEDPWQDSEQQALQIPVPPACLMTRRHRWRLVDAPLSVLPGKAAQEMALDMEGTLGVPSTQQSRACDR